MEYEALSAVLKGVFIGFVIIGSVAYVSIIAGCVKALITKNDQLV